MERLSSGQNNSKGRSDMKPGMRGISWVFARVANVSPLPSDPVPSTREKSDYLRKILGHIRDALDAAGANVKLVAHDAPREKWLPSNNVRHANSFDMRRGNFNPRPGKLKQWSKWKGAQMRIRSDVANDAVRRAIAELSSAPRPKGRPYMQRIAAEAYFEIYPDGHKAVAPNWETARRAVNKQLTLKRQKPVSPSTLKRAVNKYGPGQKTGQKRN